MSTEKSNMDSNGCCQSCHRGNGHLRVVIQLLVDITIWVAVGLPVIVLYKGGVKPTKRGFFCDDNSIKYPFIPDTIPDSILMGVGFGVSFLLLIITELPRACSSKEKFYMTNSFGVFFKTSMVFVFGFTIMEVFIQSLKYSVGRLRPHFLDVCKPDFSKINCSQGYITEYECSDTMHMPHVLRRSRTSFPSGHAGFSMYCAIFISLYLEKRFVVWFSRILRLIIQISMVLISLLCSVSRLNDNKHHVSDVVFGSLIGVVVGVLTFKCLGEKALRTREVTLQVPFIRRKMIPETLEPRTPTPLLQRQNSSFTSADSKRYLCKGSDLNV